MIHSIWQQLLLIEFEKNKRRSAQFVYCKSNRNNLELRSGDHDGLRVYAVRMPPPQPQQGQGK